MKPAPPVTIVRMGPSLLMPVPGSIRRQEPGEERLLLLPGRAEPGLDHGEAEAFQDLVPAAQAGVLHLDGGHDLVALGLGEPVPGGAERRLAVPGRLGLVAGPLPVLAP